MPDQAGRQATRPIRCKCGRTYEEHQRDKPKHLFQGFVWMAGRRAT